MPKAIQKKHITAIQNLTGNVDLGMSFKNPEKKKIRKNKKKRTRTTTTTTTTQIPITSEPALKETVPTPEPKVQQTPPVKHVKKSTTPKSVKSSTLSPDERKIKSAKLREKLARLTPEQRQRFFQAKRDRAALKKKLNDTSA